MTACDPHQFEEVNEFVGILSRGQVHKVSGHSVAQARAGLNGDFTGGVTECRPLLEKGKRDHSVCCYRTHSLCIRIHTHTHTHFPRTSKNYQHVDR